MSIKLSQSLPTSIRSYVYSDLHLDLEEIPARRNTNDNSQSPDIQADYDIYAVINNIKSIFNTRPGQRLLYPTFGIYLGNFLFEPVNDSIARRIGETIYEGIRAYENRVVVKQVYVIPIPEDQTYEVNITLFIPNFDISTEVAATLGIDGLTFN